MTPGVGRHTVIERDPSVYVVELDGEAVLLDEGHNRLHLLNTTANLVWTALDGVATVDDLSGELADAFDVDRSQVLHEVMAVLEHLVDDGLARIIR